ncbi:MAG: signal transduction histidine kinase [Cognaticolwellia sp.]|jgi:signal transduction histidine kinase
MPASINASSTPRIPYNEAARLEALHNLDILDTGPEKAFDRITRLAATIIGTPVALVSLIDADRQWSKSAHGVEPSEMIRKDAFCSHAILQDDVMVVPNATMDPRFADNPLVTAEQGIRFYAGAPLMLNDNLRLGTLCTVGFEPREMSAREIDALRDLAAIVVDELKLRLLVQTQAATNAILNERTRELAIANQSLDQFAYMASHDLRGPLQTIIGMADIAGPLASELNREPLRFIGKAAKNLDEVVLGYRRLSRLSCGEKQNVALKGLVERARQQAAPNLEVDVPVNVNIHCDPVLLTQVLTNLLTNAEQYASQPKIEIRAQVGGSTTVIRAESPVREAFAVDATIFTPFKRFTNDGDGTGLGLAIVDRVVKLHGGSAAAGCSDSTFWIELVLPA